MLVDTRFRKKDIFLLKTEKCLYSITTSGVRINCSLQFLYRDIIVFIEI